MSFPNIGNDFDIQHANSHACSNSVDCMQQKYKYQQMRLKEGNSENFDLVGRGAKFNRNDIVL